MGEGEDVTQVGTCKWFNVLKGYGFITPDSGGEDVFVHQSELDMDGFRSLDAGERVRFVVRKRSEGNEATCVTSAEPGGKLRGSSIRPLGKNRPHVIRCFKCGHYGHHTAAKCKTTVGNEKACYGCHATDHLVADCPLKRETIRAIGPKKKNAAKAEKTEKVEEVKANEEKQSKMDEKVDVDADAAAAVAVAGDGDDDSKENQSQQTPEVNDNKSETKNCSTC